jgi:hypothetical protein
MIVLDEQLLGRGLDRDIARWYQGPVCYITDLRPRTVVKDDAIPHLLRRENCPTFVTINVDDFWRRAPASSDFCVVCFALPDSRASEIPAALRALLSGADFNTRAKRSGKVIRVADRRVSYYGVTHPDVQTVPL